MSTNSLTDNTSKGQFSPVGKRIQANLDNPFVLNFDESQYSTSPNHKKPPIPIQSKAFMKLKDAREENSNHQESTVVDSTLFRLKMSLQNLTNSCNSLNTKTIKIMQGNNDTFRSSLRKPPKLAFEIFTELGKLDHSISFAA